LSTESAAGLQAGLHVATRFGSNHAALVQAVVFSADDFQIQGPDVAMLV
jgi:hypothetical protein